MKLKKLKKPRGLRGHEARKKWGLRPVKATGENNPYTKNGNPYASLPSWYR